MDCPCLPAIHFLLLPGVDTANFLGDLLRHFSLDEHILYSFVHQSRSELSTHTERVELYFSKHLTSLSTHHINVLRQVCVFTVQQLELIANYQFLGSNPTLALYEEGVTDSSGDGFTIDLQVYQFVLFVAEKANNSLQGTFAGFGIFSPYQLIRHDVFNRNQAILGMDQRACNKAVIAGNAASDETANGTTKETICSAVNSSFERSIPATGFDTALNSISNCTTDSTRDRTLCSANGCTGSEAGNTARSYYSSNNGSANNQGCTDGNLSPVGQRSGTGFIPVVDRIIHTVDEELVAVDVAISTQSFHIVCIDEPTQIRVVVPAAQIVQTGFFIKDIAAIPEGVQGTQRIGQRARLAGGLAPGIVRIGYHLRAVAVNQTDDIILLVVEVGAGSSIEQNHSRLVLRVVEEVQGVAAVGHMHKVLAVKRVLGRAGRGSHLLHPQALFVIEEADRFAALAIDKLNTKRRSFRFGNSA